MARTGTSAQRAAADGRQRATGTKSRPAAKKDSSEELRTKSGVLITPEVETSILEEAEAGFDVSKMVPRKTPGRPSLSSHGGRSHRISVRLDDETYSNLQQVAENVGRRPSELVREVLRAAYSPK